MKNLALLLLLATALFACSFRDDRDASRLVTYSVESKGIPCTLLIAYNDESGRQVDVSTEGRWEQTVRLPSGKMADISVSAIMNVGEYLKMPVYSLPEEEEGELPPVPISVKISQRGHKILCTGYEILCASMDDLDAIYF